MKTRHVSIIQELTLLEIAEINLKKNETKKLKPGENSIVFLVGIRKTKDSLNLGGLNVLGGLNFLPLMSPVVSMVNVLRDQFNDEFMKEYIKLTENKINPVVIVQHGPYNRRLRVVLYGNKKIVYKQEIGSKKLLEPA